MDALAQKRVRATRMRACERTDRAQICLAQKRLYKRLLDPTHRCQATSARPLRESLQAQCALPAGSRSDRSAHTRIMQQVHEHMSRPKYTGRDCCTG
mmetsp:Transcript_11095/g.15877  ORF Transcript_11095/g.15877 Transcript_11095/m.15877 type:complete len:97 (-) Transcript_11095:168-458(-)